MQSKNIVKETRYQHRSNKPFRHLPHSNEPHGATVKPETDTPKKVGIEAFFTLFRSGDVVRTPVGWLALALLHKTPLCFCANSCDFAVKCELWAQVGVDTIFTSLHCFPVSDGTLLIVKETEIGATSASDSAETCRSAPHSAPVHITPGRLGSPS